jgi:hypothetical protein
VRAGRGRGLGDRLQARARRLRQWFFPPRIELPAEVTRLLRAIYPSLDLAAVSFHAGIPHLVRTFECGAITLPALLARHRTCVYVGPAAWDPESVEGLGTLVHEAFHALQAQEAGWGWGPFRPFILLYFAAGAANGFRYRGHPMEEDAYRLAGEPASRFESMFSGAERPDLAGVERAGLAVYTVESVGPRFWPALARSLPLKPPLLALPLVPVWFLLWAGAVALAWLGRLLVEASGAFVVALLWGCGVFISAIEPFLYRHT